MSIQRFRDSKVYKYIYIYFNLLTYHYLNILNSKTG